jgi:hypothetical protein
MTTLQEKLAEDTLRDALLNLTNDLDTVVGIKVTSAMSAEIWISSPGARSTIQERCAAHEALSELALKFREDLSEAETSGGAAKRPRNSEPKNENQSDATFAEFADHVADDSYTPPVDE